MTLGPTSLPALSVLCGKSSHQPPASLLHPLPVPRYPWSHIAVDFVTGLPPSKGKSSTDHRRPFLQLSAFCAPPEAPLGGTDGSAHSSSLRSVPAVHILGMAELLRCSRGHSERGLQAITRSSMARRSRRTRASRVRSGAWWHCTPPPGALARCGWSTPTNTLVSVAFGFSPFMAARDQPPLFKYLEEEAAIPLVRADLRRCRRVWHQVHASLTRFSLQSQHWASRHRSVAPTHRDRGSGWLTLLSKWPRGHWRRGSWGPLRLCTSGSQHR